MSLAESHRPHYLIICDNDSTVIKLELKYFFWWSWFLTCIFISIDGTLMRTIGSRATTDIRNHFSLMPYIKGQLILSPWNGIFRYNQPRYLNWLWNTWFWKASHKNCHFWRLNTLLLPLGVAMNRNSYVWNSLALEELPLFFNI